MCRLHHELIFSHDTPGPDIGYIGCLELYKLLKGFECAVFPTVGLSNVHPEKAVTLVLPFCLARQ